MIKAENIIEELKQEADPKLAEHAQKFFKTGKGEYAEGDLFFGLKTPFIQGLSKKYYKDISFDELEKLLNNKYHEARVVALVMLTLKFEKAAKEEKGKIVELYLRNVHNINNWDLVDISCYKIIGRYVFENNKNEILYQLSESGHLWSERISVVSCMYPVKKGDFKVINDLAVKFLDHKHDLMHKAVGWILREMGKKEEKELHKFLQQYSKKMPRTMLRYSIEKLTAEQRKEYMEK